MILSEAIKKKIREAANCKGLSIPIEVIPLNDQPPITTGKKGWTEFSSIKKSGFVYIPRRLHYCYYSTLKPYGKYHKSTLKIIVGAKWPPLQRFLEPFQKMARNNYPELREDCPDEIFLDYLIDQNSNWIDVF